MATINSKIEGVDVLGVVTAGETIYVGRATSTQHGIVKPAATDFEFDAQTNAMRIKLGIGLKRTDDGITIAIYDGNVVTDVLAVEDGLEIKYADIDEKTENSKVIPWSEFTTAETEYLKKYFNIEPGTGEGAVQQIGAKATGKQSAAFGGLRYDKQTGRTPTSADGNQSFAAGGSVHAEGDFSAVFGKDTVARQRASFAAGSSTAGMTEEEFNAFFWDSTNNVGLHGGSKNSNGEICDFTGATYEKSFAFATALGCDCEAKGPRSFAAGDNVKAQNTGAVAVGARTTASGSNSFTAGADTTASGDTSFAANHGTKATGSNSSAFGLNTKAAGNHSVTFGEDTETSAPGAVAEGYKTKASGEHSHAGGGQFTEAAGFNSFAYGANVHADAENSAAFGYETVAKSPNSFVVGKDNALRENALFQVGNGTNWNDRKDAFVVLKDGRAKLQAGPIDDDDIVRKEDLGYEIDFPHGEPTVRCDNTDGITVTGTMRIYLNQTKTVFRDVPNVSVEIPIFAGKNVTIDADETNKKAVVKASDIDVNTLIPLLLGSNGIKLTKNEAGDRLLIGISRLGFELGTFEATGDGIKFAYNDSIAEEIYLGASLGGAIDIYNSLVSIDNYIRVKATADEYVEINNEDVIYHTASGVKHYLREDTVKTIGGQSIYGSGDISVGGGTIDANTLNGLLLSGNGITISYEIASDKVQINVDPRFIVFGNQSIDVNPNGYATEVYITDDPSVGYYEFTSDHAGEIRYNHNSNNDTMVLQSGTKGNVKTLFGNQSIYGSGNIDLYNHTLIITGATPNISTIHAIIMFTSSSNTKIDSLTDLYTACSKFGEMPASGHIMKAGKICPIYSALCNSGDGIHFVEISANDTSGVAWTEMQIINITDTVTTV